MRAVLLLSLVAACEYPAIALPDAGEVADGEVVDAPEIDAPEIDAPAIDAPEIDAPDDAAIDAPACPQGDRRCEGNTVTECQVGSWTTIISCPNLCNDGACVTPPSCSGGVNACGIGASETCCAARPLPGGTFSRSFDGVSTGYTDDRYQATVSAFHLDVYEVTRARFQKFVDAYPLSAPQAGTGRNPNDPADPGWLSAWNAALPATAVDLTASLACDSLVAQNAQDPVRCVSWYVAQAFCIWDGGRLPTEAEWNFAAAGGAEQRVYPWSAPPTSTTISASHATYGVSAPTSPGAHGLDGGRWGHVDLAGNVREWVFDNFSNPYPSTACTDCANHSAASTRATRGGSFLNSATNLLAAARGSSQPTTLTRSTGMRCARNPVP